MTTRKKRRIDRGPELKSSPACANLAVAHCCDAWELAFEAAFAHNDNEYAARSIGGEAYRNAMPALTGFQSICDFIACVTHGILIGAIPDKSGSKLLYAAQVALSLDHRQPKTPASNAA
jgi:hypothetical protein